MKKARKVPELVTQLKAVKIERNLSNQDIVDLLHAKGYGTSISSVKRFFADGSEDVAFSYEDTIKPLVEVLLVDATPVPVEELDSLADAQQYIDQIEGLQADALLKDKVIEDLTTNNSTLQQTAESQFVTIQQQEAIIKQQEKTIANLKKKHANDKIKISLLVAAFVILTLLVFAYLIIHDAPNPEYGILPSIFAGETAGLVEQVAQWVKL